MPWEEWICSWDMFLNIGEEENLKRVLAGESSIRGVSDFNYDGETVAYIMIKNEKVVTLSPEEDKARYNE